MSLLSPLNILEGFFTIRLDTLHCKVGNAGTVLNGDVVLLEFSPSVKVTELDPLVDTDRDGASAMSSPSERAMALISSSCSPSLSL